MQGELHSAAPHAISTLTFAITCAINSVCEISATLRHYDKCMTM